MGVFVVLSLTLLAAALGAVVMAAVRLKATADRLKQTVDATTSRTQPLLQELHDEAAVASLELEALQRRTEHFRDSRRSPKD